MFQSSVRTEEAQGAIVEEAVHTHERGKLFVCVYTGVNAEDSDAVKTKIKSESERVRVWVGAARENNEAKRMYACVAREQRRREESVSARVCVW